jgi:predicted ATPase
MKKPSFKIDYCPNGDNINGFNLDQYREKAIELYTKAVEDKVEVVWSTCSTLGVDLIRLLVCEAMFDADEVRIYSEFNGETIVMDHFGIFDKWPKGFMDAEEKICREIIRGRRDKRAKDISEILSGAFKDEVN